VVYGGSTLANLLALCELFKASLLGSCKYFVLKKGNRNLWLWEIHQTKVVDVIKKVRHVKIERMVVKIPKSFWKHHSTHVCFVCIFLSFFQFLEEALQFVIILKDNSKWLFLCLGRLTQLGVEPCLQGWKSDV